VVAGGLSACSLPGGPPAGPRKRVIVVGAGLAGLVAGWELGRAGHDVTIVEARGEPGGRVQTLRAPFADGLYAEAGPIFIPDNHDLTLGYVRLFDLPLEPVDSRGTGKIYFVRGRRFVVTRGARVTWPVELTTKETRPTGGKTRPMQARRME